ncbi:hypothetical protein ACJRO7_013367 [Eucalyptus globulus]|uniref:Uncharacterized protein n=1 Tax=Eucalyptus globulus TaxID=34317 RepID=A0ABD3KXP0_EUCGL
MKAGSSHCALAIALQWKDLEVNRSAVFWTKIKVASHCSNLEINFSSVPSSSRLDSFFGVVLSYPTGHDDERPRPSDQVRRNVGGRMVSTGELDRMNTTLRIGIVYSQDVKRGNFLSFVGVEERSHQFRSVKRAVLSLFFM